MAPSRIKLNSDNQNNDHQNSERPDDLHEPHEIFITFSDIAALLKKQRKKIYRSSIAFALIALLYAITRPVQFEAEATFKEKGMAKPSFDNYTSITMLMLRENTPESHAMTMMQSRRLIEQLIQQQNLQASLEKDSYKFSLIPFETIKNNILSELGILKKSEFPVIEDQILDIAISEIVYDGEIPKALKLRVIDDETFEVADGENQTLEQGSFGILFKSSLNSKAYSFNLTKQSLKNLSGSLYSLKLIPLQTLAKATIKQFTIQPDKEDKTIIKIRHENKDRFQASKNVNALMALYQKYIYDEHCKLCQMQTAYLISRQNEMAEQLEAMMQNYAYDLTSDLTTTGFASSGKAMEYLATNQQELKRKLFTINLELQRIDNARHDPSFDGELFTSTQELSVFNKIAGEKRQLKQLYDTLNLSIRSIPEDSRQFHEAFQKLLSEKDLKLQLIAETEKMLTALEHNELPLSSPVLVDNREFIVKEWHSKLALAKDHFDKNASDLKAFDEWKQCKEGFACYLERLNHFLKISEKNLEERLANQQSSNSTEYSGINLETAKELYMAYSKELCNLESTAKEHEFLISQIDKKDFEITSLSSVLSDPVSAEMIHRANLLLLEIKDLNNRSMKEFDRLNSELAIQKGFLKTHLEQSTSIFKLREDILRKKIKEIQNVNFSLIQEELAILENQLSDYLKVATINLTDEQNLLVQNLAEIRGELATLPQKFTKEQLIDHQMTINKTLIEEISKLVESKNVSNNLATFQSAPVDISHPPLHPKSPRLLLFTILGGFLGAFFGFTWILAFSFIQGLEISMETLKSMGLHVSGKISRQILSAKEHPFDSDLETLRRMVLFMKAQAKMGGRFSPVFVLIEGNGPDYSPLLCDLLSREGLKIIALNLNFSLLERGKEKGLLQYLDNQASLTEIIKKGSFDTISSGGISRYANETIGSKTFSDLILELHKDYNLIIIKSNALANSTEAECLIEKFKLAAVTIKDEPVKEISNMIALAQNPKYHITFIFEF